jgi:aminopeptidase N
MATRTRIFGPAWKARRLRWLKVPLTLGGVVLSCGGGVVDRAAPAGDAGGTGGTAGVGAEPEAGRGQDASLGGAAGAAPSGPKADRDTDRDILSTHLELDLATRTGIATIELKGSELSSAATFEMGDLTIESVEGEEGPLDFEVGMGRRGALLDVGVPPSAASSTLVIAYAFESHRMFDGWNATTRTSFLWPYFCGNLFPCRSTPADGVKFSMNVSGYAAGEVALYPRSLETEAPSYMLGLTVGPLIEVELGATTNGTVLAAWLLPGQDREAAARGTANLVSVFDFYEQTYGDYAFGTEAGSVAVDWGGSGFRGMEHHPYWHINQSNFAAEVVHAHEAAHGWFGNGVRLACWEDFVLAEGTASYLAARALEQVNVDAWPEYECRLKRVCDPVVLSKPCHGVDILNDPIGSGAPYMKGAFFFREVAQLIGPELLDDALGEFYRANVGQAASTEALLATIRDSADDAVAGQFDELVQGWLRSPGCPISVDGLCSM